MADQAPQRAKAQPDAATWTVVRLELHNTFWFGMAMCDTQSYPETVSTCTPDSDSNILWASQAGVDSIEHGSYIDDAGIAEMKKNGTYLVPTLYLGDWFLANAEKNHVPDFILAKAKAVMPAARQNIAHAFASGVKVAFGTDAAAYPHGLNAHEFAVMVKLGLTPLQAIQAATVNAADLLGWSGKVGSLEPGAWADIVAVEGDPLKDVTTLERVKFVMKDGEVNIAESYLVLTRPNNLNAKRTS